MKGIIAGLFIILSIIVTWPLILHLTNFIIDNHDGLLITWYLNWDIHSLANLPHFFDANIFYPYRNTLTFSDFMLPEALLAAPFVWLFKEPLLAYNLNFLLGFALTGFATYLLAKFLTKDNKISLLAGVLFAFSTIHLSYMAHIQLFNFWPVIFTTLFLWQKRYKLFILFFVISALTTALFLYFLLLIVAIYFLQKKDKKIIVTTAIAGLLTTPFLLPYFLVSKQFNYVRPITDAIHFSLQFPDLANIGNASRLSLLFPPLPDATPAYFGAIFLALIFLVMLSLSQHLSRMRVWLYLAGTSFVLSLGPALHIFRTTVHFGPIPAIPLPYAILYFLVPGFSGFRTPSRWIILTAFALVMAIAIHFAKKINLSLLLLLFSLILLEINFPFNYYFVPSRQNFPLEQQWLAENFTNQPLIFFPIYNWDDKDFGQETLREYYSTSHYHPMFNGYSGFSPKEWEAKVKWLQQNFPSQESLNYLQSLKIKLIIVPHSWQANMLPYSQMKLIKEFPDTDIFELL